MIKIIGAKGNIQNVESFLKKINNFSKNNKIIIQVFNADIIYGKNPLISAFEHAKRSFERNKNTTNSLEMEILLYASGERQLKTAIPKIGIKNGKSNIAFLLINNKISNQLINQLLGKLSLTRDDEVLNGDIKTLKKFGITELELKTIKEEKYVNLILEKIALVDIIK